jgi:hypothetical protein
LYAAKVQSISQHSPWDHFTFDQRLALMMRGSPRAAYFYSVPDTSTFRYRAYNVVQALTAAGTRGSPSAGWFTDADLDRIGRVLD